MPAGFAPGKGTHTTQDPALRFEMTQAGGDFFQTAVRTTAKGEERAKARIDLVYGANLADEVFFSWRGDRLYELPMAWLHPLNCWGNTSINPFGSGDFTREATTRCLECHNTWLGHVAGTTNQYQREHLLLGVTCERCHGPGREHVAFHRAHPEAKAAHAVVDPRRLTRERQLEVCTQCHSNAPKRRGPAFSYRPGEPLESYFRTSKSKYPEDDHVANQVQYLRQSKCFQKSDTLTCTTCHNPHRPPGPGHSALAQRSCLKCHQAADCGEQPHLPAAVRSNCVGCHMPQRVWMNVHFHTADDGFVPPIRRYQHRIAVDTTARQEVLLAHYRQQSGAASRREADRLTRALVTHWLAEADRYRRQYRFLAVIGALREALRLEDAPATRAQLRQAVAFQAKLDADLVLALHQVDQKQFPQAIETLQRILTVKPDHALAHGKLGSCYAVTGRKDLAVEHLQAVALHDPDLPYGYEMLGWLAYLGNRSEEAVDFYRRANAIEPLNAQINHRWGLALVKLARWEEAGDCFRRVLTIDPRHAGGCQGQSIVLRQQGRPEEAERFARRAAQLTGFQNADILLTLAESYAEAGRFGDAADTAAKALGAAKKNDPKMVPTIRDRLEEFQAKKGEESESRATGEGIPALIWGLIGVGLGLGILRVLLLAAGKAKQPHNRVAHSKENTDHRSEERMEPEKPPGG
jgi:tetratricopeptide (TPR) repeat protein